MNNTSVDSYLAEGCGRCDHFQKPTCKVHLWTPILKAIRTMFLEAGLTETMKWGSPCYTLGGKNVAMIVSQRASCALQFFKGAVLADPASLLEAPGPNSHHSRYLKMSSMAEFRARKLAATALVQAAIKAEREGLATPATPRTTTLPDELIAALGGDAKLHAAWAALTPGRQRSHMLHVAGAAQSVTRQRRAAKCSELILLGRGFNERV